MIRSALAGLRGRLLLAFVATSAVTLLIAVAITLSPLQSQLREDAIATTRSAAEDERREFVEVFAETNRNRDEGPKWSETETKRLLDRSSRLFTPAYDLRRRTGGARVLVADKGFTESDGNALPSSEAYDP